MFRPLSVAAACSSKLNPRQKRLRSASPHALLIRPPNGCVEHELHSSALVEESLRDHRVERRHRTQNGSAGHDIADHLLGAGIVDTALLFQPCDGFGHLRIRLA